MTIRIAADRYRAVIFDLDGVITDTASVHAMAWKELFDDYLAHRPGRRPGQTDRPFSTEDYRRYVDGKPRYDGVESFLLSRQITLPRGEPRDSPEEETICGLGNRKNHYFEERLDREGVRVFDDTVAFIGRLSAAGVVPAVISASRNCLRVLERAGLEQLFAVRVDGIVADELHLRGKPDPAVFVEAARRLNVPPSHAVVVEDALAGVHAGRDGGFGMVIGVDRVGGRSEELEGSGADFVVRSLDMVEVVGPTPEAVEDHGGE